MTAAELIAEHQHQKTSLAKMLRDGDVEVRITYEKKRDAAVVQARQRHSPEKVATQRLAMAELERDSTGALLAYQIERVVSLLF